MEIKQRYALWRLNKSVLKDYADDPDVEFIDAPPIDENAPHGVNTEEEMMHSAESVAD